MVLQTVGNRRLNVSSYAAMQPKLNRKTLGTKYQAALQLHRSPGRKVDRFFCPKQGGRPTYLSCTGRRVLNSCVHFLDQAGFPVARGCIPTIMRQVKATMLGKAVTDVSLPSRKTADRLAQQLDLPLRHVRYGASIRGDKSKEAYLVDFYQKLSALVEEHNFLPKDIWNIDEVGISFNEMLAVVVTSVKAARRERVSVGHTTLTLSTNAVGDVGDALFIHEGSHLSAVPSATIKTDFTVFTEYNESAYMTRDLFERFLHRFADGLQSKQRMEAGVRPILILLDGHNSRLNFNLLMSLAVRNVYLLELPSHLTHLLQPNDSGVNKVLKDELRDQHSRMVSAGLVENRTDITCFVLEALSQKRMKRAIINSWRHCGCWPVDASRVETLLKNERHADKYVNSLEMKAVVEALDKVLQDTRALLERTRARAQDTPRKKSPRKSFFSQAYAICLSKPEAIACLMQENLWSQVKKLHAAPLQEHMAKHFKEADLVYQDGSKAGKKLNKNDMLTLEYNRIASLQSSLLRAVSLRMERMKESRVENVDEFLEEASARSARGQAEDALRALDAYHAQHAANAASAVLQEGLEANA